MSGHNRALGERLQGVREMKPLFGASDARDLRSKDGRQHADVVRGERERVQMFCHAQIEGSRYSGACSTSSTRESSRRGEPARAKAASGLLHQGSC